MLVIALNNTLNRPIKKSDMDKYVDCTFVSFQPLFISRMPNLFKLSSVSYFKLARIH